MKKLMLFLCLCVGQLYAEFTPFPADIKKDLCKLEFTFCIERDEDIDSVEWKTLVELFEQTMHEFQESDEDAQVILKRAYELMQKGHDLSVDEPSIHGRITVKAAASNQE